ncbi:hypothetical protein SAMN05216199_2598 [Pedococcus cremeus]|uniref:Uncharacterized protein n=1 Tax=Pedococcus cremeus TaxID=587636 RepID=A0A1H9VVS0_9MICO|nr:hypothetical protein [Pedococcus cremeus]SES25765.1 hypothetical protein SAMN05216199_2598 [Pedococcus cremeus]
MTLVVITKVVAVEDPVLSRATGTLRAAQSKAPIDALGSAVATARGAVAVLDGADVLDGAEVEAGPALGDVVRVVVSAGVVVAVADAVRAAGVLGLVVADSAVPGVADGPSSAWAAGAPKAPIPISSTAATSRCVRMTASSSAHPLRR